MRFPSQAQKKNTEIPFSNRRYWQFRFQIEDIGIIFQKSPKRHGNPVFKWGSHHKPRKNTEIPISNRRYWHYFPEVAITSPKKGKSRFQIEDIGIIFQRFPSQAQKREIPFSNRRYWHYFPEKPRKNTEIPFSNRRYWHYFPEVPITSPKKGKSRFQIEDIGIIFQRFPSQAQKKGNPVFKWGSHHKPKKTRKFRFQIEDIGIIFQRFPSQAQKKGIPFSNRRYWHYFPEKPKKTRKSRFQMRFPTSPEKTRKSRFQIEDIGIIFQRFPSQAKKTTEIPFSNRRYWHYFPEVPIPSPKKGKSRFQIEDIGIIFQKSPKRHGNPVFKWGSHHKPRKNTEIPFSNRRYWHYFPEVPITSPKKGKSRFQIEDIGIIFQKSPKRHGNPEMRFPSQAQKKHGNPVFK